MFRKISILQVVAIVYILTIALPAFSETPTESYLRSLRKNTKFEITPAWFIDNIELMKSFFEGTYTFESKDKEKILYFPGTDREPPEGGYQAYIRPLKPYYAKIPQKSLFSFKITHQGLIVNHVSLDGSYTPDQLGKRIKSKVVLHPLEPGETVTYFPSSKEIVIRIRRGNLIAGSSIKILIKKLSNGNIELQNYYKGWCPFPAPIPIKMSRSYILKRKGP